MEVTRRILTHVKCRNGFYPRSDVARVFVPDDKVSWNESMPGYEAPVYTSSCASHSNADPNPGTPQFSRIKWNCFDGSVNRTSHLGRYELRNGIPLNPVGRTGLAGRGLLWRWGPNHAADPIVTRWKRRNGVVVVNESTGKPQLEFVAVQRRDSLEWAIPGGMVDPGEVVSTTLKREFLEEATNSIEMSSAEKEDTEKALNRFFESGVTVYEGYVDDPRNTDNAWMETVAQNFHDETGEQIGGVQLKAGDDAVNVSWTDVSSQLSLYASHLSFIENVAVKLKAHW